MNAAAILSHDVGKKAACKVLDIPRASFYRHMSNKPQVTQPRPASPLALTGEEKKRVIELLHSERFQDKAPHQIYAALLDEGDYYCSIRTMYRILKEVHGRVKERRRHVQRPKYSKPELLATQPNEIWSWDITRLKGPVKRTYFYLFTISRRAK